MEKKYFFKFLIQLWSLKLMRHLRETKMEQIDWSFQPFHS